MVIHSAEAYRYRLEYLGAAPAPRVATLDGLGSAMREGFLLRLESERGVSAWGDVAPLPGRSVETINDVEAELRTALRALPGSPIPDSWDDLTARRPMAVHCASVAFGLEQATATLAAFSAGMPVALWMNPGARKRVRVNALLAGSPDEVIALAVRRLAEGFTAFKVKVSDIDAADVRRLTRAVRETLGKRPELRLDANRAWEYDEAAAALRGLADLDIAWVEEPLLDPALTRRLASDAPIPIALDETIEEVARDGFEPREYAFIRAAVLKPTLIGGWVRTRRLAAALVGVGVEPVVSSAFESEVGLSGLAELAAALPGAGLAAGLDTLRFFRRGLVSPEREGFGPVVSIGETTGAEAPDRSRLVSFETSDF